MVHKGKECDGTKSEQAIKIYYWNIMEASDNDHLLHHNSPIHYIWYLDIIHYGKNYVYIYMTLFGYKFLAASHSFVPSCCVPFSLQVCFQSSFFYCFLWFSCIVCWPHKVSLGQLIVLRNNYSINCAMSRVQITDKGIGLGMLVIHRSTNTVQKEETR